MISIKKAADLITVPSILVWGDNGAGKSQFMGSVCKVPELQPSLIIDCEPKGSQTIKDNYPDCDVVEFEDGKPMYKQFDEVNELIKSNGIKFVGIDGASYLIDSTLNDFPMEKWKDGTEAAAYNKVYAIIKRWYTQIESMCSCICTTCLSGSLKSSDGKLIGQKPLIPGNNFEKIFFSLFNTVAIMKVVKVQGKPVYQLSTKTGGINFSRTKAKAVYEMDMFNPTMEKFYGTLMGKEVIHDEADPVVVPQPNMFNKK